MTPLGPPLRFALRDNASDRLFLSWCPMPIGKCPPSPFQHDEPCVIVSAVMEAADCATWGCWTPNNTCLSRCDPANKARLRPKMVHDHELPAGPADTEQLADHALRVRCDGDDVHRDHHIEMRIRIVECASVHHLQFEDLAQPFAGHTASGPVQHLRSEIDAKYTHVPRIGRQRQTRSNTDLEHTCTRPKVHPPIAARRPGSRTAPKKAS
jgi:hypothetical protein